MRNRIKTHCRVRAGDLVAHDAKADKTPPLTARIVTEITNRLKAGASERVAVESADLSWEVYQQWLDRGAQPRAGRLYRRLAREVVQAQAHAQLMAEMHVRDTDAKAWLLHGPGRETATRPGWGAAAKPAACAGEGEQADSGRKLLFELCAIVLEALAPYPEARIAVAEAVQRWQDGQATSAPLPDQPLPVQPEIAVITQTEELP